MPLRRLGQSDIRITSMGLGCWQFSKAGGMGSCSFAGDHAGLSIGTTSVMVTHVPFKRTDLFNELVSMPSPTPGEYFVMAENGIGGRAVDHFLKNVALFLAAPFIGLLYALALPIVGAAALAWMAVRAIGKNAAAMRVINFVAAPFIGLAFVIALPFAGTLMLGWYGARSLIKKARTG